MNRLPTDLFDAADADTEVAPELGGLPDTVWHFSFEGAASAGTAALIVDSGPEHDVSAVDAAGSSAPEAASDVSASLTYHAAEPTETNDIDVYSGSGEFLSGRWQQEIDDFRFADTGLDDDCKSAQNDSCAAGPVSSAAASSGTLPNILADLPNPLATPNGVSINNPGGDSNLAPRHNQSIGATPDLKFVDPEGPEPVADNIGTVGSSHSGPAEDSSTVSASSGINISQVTTNANGSLSETVTFAGSGIVFNDTFDATVTQAYKNCILSAEQTIASEWSNSVTINEEFSTQAEGQNGELASNEFYVYGVSYAALKGALTTLASQEPNDPYLQQALAHLPSTDPSGGAGFELALPYARMLGLTSSSESPDDIVTLNTSYNWSYGQDVINTVEHEISEGGMGRIGGLGDQNSFWSVMDLFRYNSSGVPDYSDGRDGQTTYFSFNGGATLSRLSFNNEFNSHGQQVNGGDTADFVQLDVFGTGNLGETNTLSQTDIQIMEALGWDPPPQGPVVTVSNVTLSAGQASVAASSLFTASDPNGDSITEYGFMDTGPGYFVLSGVTEPDNQEIDVTAAQLSQLTYQSTPGTNDTLQIRAEDETGWGNWASFTVTAPPLVIRTDGSTSLTEVANSYFLDGSGGSGPELKFEGTDVVAGQFGGWVPIGAVQTATGYDVAWKMTGVDEYTAWNTDSNGNYISNIIGQVPGTSPTLEALEPIFDQNLNGDGDLTTTVMQTDGSTSLVEVGNQLLSVYYLNNGGGPSFALKYGGADVTAGEFGGWVPIGAVQTATGYDVAWKMTGVDEYTAWNTDSNGNYISNIIGQVPGTSPTLEALEPIFQQDLNGDGTIGLTTTVIATDGSTSLTEVANSYFLDGSGGSGPELKFEGTDVVAGQFGGWVPIGAVQTATGYDVAWKMTGVDEYTAWNTDSNGNYISNIIGQVPGTSPTLEALEPIFDQNLNGDGDLTTTVMQTDGSTSLVEVGNQLLSVYYLNNGGGPSFALKYGGADVTAGEFGGWVPIGAVQTATGYDVAWKMTGVDEYTAWNTDSNGNYISNIIGQVPGTSPTLEALEPIFDQNLNGDGDLTTTVMQTDGSTSLVEVGNQLLSVYYLNNGGGPSFALKYGGADVTAGEFGGWVPIGAVQTATGYDVAWKMTGVDEYTAWNTDSNGNYISNIIGQVPGTSYALEALEPIFQQDLNGDGVIGVPATAALSPQSEGFVIASGVTVEVAAGSASATFAASTGMLKLDNPSTFSGEIFWFTGDRTLSSSDQIDLKGINYNTIQDSYANGLLTVTDGTDTVHLSFSGPYSVDNFKFASDGNRGTIVYDPPASSSNASSSAPQHGAAPSETAIIAAGSNATLIADGAKDTFEFPPHLGQPTINDFVPATDTIQFDRTSFATAAAALAAARDDGHGNVLIADTAHDTLTQHDNMAALLHHANFLIV